MNHDRVRRRSPSERPAVAVVRRLAIGSPGRPGPRPARNADPVRRRLLRLVADLDAAGGRAIVPQRPRVPAGRVDRRAPGSASLPRSEAGWAHVPGMALSGGGFRLLLAGRRPVVRGVVDLAGRFGWNERPHLRRGAGGLRRLLRAASSRPALLSTVPAPSGRGGAVLARRRHGVPGWIDAPLVGPRGSPRRAQPHERRGPRALDRVSPGRSGPALRHGRRRRAPEAGSRALRPPPADHRARWPRC